MTDNGTPFEDLTHDEQREFLLKMSRQDVIDVLLITADRVNELEKAIRNIRDHVWKVMDTADVVEVE